VTDVAFIAAAYGAAVVGLVGYAVSLVQRDRQARARSAAIEHARDRIVEPVVPADAMPAEEGRLRAIER